MKKVFAVVLSLVMMFAVCVPAFAASTSITITDQSAEKSGDVLLSTTTESTDATYRVVIPADQTIKWGVKLVGMQYEMHSQLALGNFLKVEVSSANGMKLLNAEATGKEIAYTFTKSDSSGSEVLPYISNTADKEVYARVIPFNITIEDAAWKAVPVAVYTDTLTFTVSIVNADGNPVVSA